MIPLSFRNRALEVSFDATITHTKSPQVRPFALAPIRVRRTISHRRKPIRTETFAGNYSPSIPNTERALSTHLPRPSPSFESDFARRRRTSTRSGRTEHVKWMEDNTVLPSLSMRCLQERYIASVSSSTSWGVVRRNLRVTGRVKNDAHTDRHGPHRTAPHRTG